MKGQKINVKTARGKKIFLEKIDSCCLFIIDKGKVFYYVKNLGLLLCLTNIKQTATNIYIYKKKCTFNKKTMHRGDT